MRTMRSAVARHAVAIAAVSVVCAAPAWAQDEQDELVRMVAVYELTMPRVESFGGAYAGLAEWATANPTEAVALRERLQRGQGVAEIVAALEREPVIIGLLERNHLTARDFVLIPSAVLQARIAVQGEAQGRTFPADRINTRNIAFARLNAARVDSIMSKVAVDRVRAFGGR